jgi:glutamate/tyrosine decarboxylase-like PLP-dependent enzyme
MKTGETNPALETLQLSPEAARALGYRIVDVLVDHDSALRGKPVTRMNDWKASLAKLSEPFGEEGLDPALVLESVERDVLSTMMHVTHPRFFAFVPGPGNLVSALAEALAAGYNVFAGTRLEGSGPSAVELVTVGWLRQTCGLPETAQGLFVSGGSVANLTALAVARKVKLGDDFRRGVAYFSDQTHSAVDRAFQILGFAASQIRKLPSDNDFRLPLGALARQVDADRKAGLQPFCVVANAGTTNTGAIDPLPELGSYCRSEELWLHADGAYGAAAVLAPRGRALLGGLGEVDSLALDPHKWLFQPFEIGCVLVRLGQQLKETFRILPEYLQDVHRVEGINFCDYRIQLTRSFRALKLWMSLRVFGVRAFREAIARGFLLAEYAERRLRQNPAWDVVSPAGMATVCFRYIPPGGAGGDLNAINQRASDLMLRDGFAGITSTVLRGRTVLRMCTINPRTTEEDIDATLDRLLEFAEESTTAEASTRL